MRSAPHDDHLYTKLCRIGLACLLTTAALHAAAETNAWNGPRRDGVFPGKDLVTTCHYDSRNPQANENMLWATELPFWGMNSPVYGHGQVYVLCDPGFEHDAPQLVAVDADTGAIAWQRDVDNLDARTGHRLGPQRAGARTGAVPTGPPLHVARAASDERGGQRGRPVGSPASWIHRQA